MITHRLKMKKLQKLIQTINIEKCKIYTIQPVFFTIRNFRLPKKRVKEEGNMKYEM